MKKHSKTQFLSMVKWASKAADALPEMYFMVEGQFIGAVNHQTGFVFGTFDMKTYTGEIQSELVEARALDMPLDKWLDKAVYMHPKVKIEKEEEGKLFAYESSSNLPFARWNSPSDYIFIG